MARPKNEVKQILREDLPTAEEYKKPTCPHDPTMVEYCEPKYQCPECDGIMCRNSMDASPSRFVQYGYRCNKCGRIEYLRY